MTEATRVVQAWTDKRARTVNERQIALMKWLSKATLRIRGPKSQRVGDHIYVVGGAVRNYVLKAPIKDVDIVIDSVALKGRGSDWYAKQLARLIPARTSLVTNQYGVAILSVQGDWMVDGHNLRGEVIEIANARTESYGGPGGKGYKPSEVKPSTIEEDMRRREFTFNTLLWRISELASGPEKAEILDLTGCGLEDLKGGVMRCPSDPDKTFKDDPSRMLRAIKFLVKYGFQIPDDVARSIQRNAPMLRQIPQEAVASLLLDTILKDPSKTDEALAEMERLGLFEVIKDLFEDDKAFRATVVNWAGDQRFDTFFKLLDKGIGPLGRVDFLDQKGLSRFRQVVEEEGEAFATRFLEALRQPGRVIDTRALMQHFGIKGREVGRLGGIARDLMLTEPRLMDDPDLLTETVAQTYALQRQSGKTASHPHYHAALGLSVPPPPQTGQLDPVMSTQYNLRECVKEMILLERHLSIARQECPDCIRKHFLTVEALLDEAMTLDCEHEVIKTHLIPYLRQFWRTLQQDWLSEVSTIRLSQEIRGLRKLITIPVFDVEQLRKDSAIKRVQVHKVARTYLADWGADDLDRFQVDAAGVFTFGGREPRRFVLLSSPIIGQPRIAFYESTGTSTRTPMGTWVPFYGIAPRSRPFPFSPWVVKNVKGKDFTMDTFEGQVSYWLQGWSGRFSYTLKFDLPNTNRRSTLEEIRDLFDDAAMFNQFLLSRTSPGSDLKKSLAMQKTKLYGYTDSNLYMSWQGWMDEAGLDRKAIYKATGKDIYKMTILEALNVAKSI